ncbi:MAG TPA: FtsX-like permease family protein, partial [Candidatus Gracilibacteria bacterium]
MDYKKVIKRSMGEAPKQIWRHKFLSFAIIFFLTVIFFVVNILASLQFLSHYFIEQLEKRADFLIPLTDHYDSFTLESLQNEITQFSKIEITDDIRPSTHSAGVDLPAYWHVRFQKLDAIAPFFDIVKKDKYSELFSNWDGKSEREFLSLTQNILQFRKAAEKLTFALMGLFGVIGILFVGQLFRLVLHQRRDEFFIARIVGAETPFLIFPVCLEGALLGLISSVLSVGLVITLLTQV